MTFYRSFANKTDLIIAVMNNLNDGYQTSALEVKASDKDISAKIRAFFNLKIQFTESIGMELMNDVMHSENKEIKQKLEEFYEQKIIFLMDLAYAAQESGEISEDIKLEMIPAIFETYEQSVKSIHGSDGDMTAVINDISDFFIRSIGLTP
jgi:hypothetical protein